MGSHQIMGPQDNQKSYQTSPEGLVWMDGKGNPLPLSHMLGMHVDHRIVPTMPSIPKGMAGLVIGRQVFTMAIGSMLMAITINEMILIRIATWTIAIRQLLDTMVINGAVWIVQVTRTVLPKDFTPGFMRLSPVVSVTQSAQLCLTLRNTSLIQN